MEIDNQTTADRVGGLIPKKAASDEEPSEFQKEMELIREKGFGAYVEDIHKKKQEELREKILKAMGLSEEQLADLPPDRRRHIEEMIAQEIQEQMAAETSQDTGGGAKLSQGGEPGDISQQVLAMRTGMGGAALAMQAVMDQREGFTPPIREEK